MNIEKVIEIARIIKDLTKEELCEMTHIDIKRLRRITNGGHAVTMQEIEKIETALGIPTGVLIWFGVTGCLSEQEGKVRMVISAFEYLERVFSGEDDRKDSE